MSSWIKLDKSFSKFDKRNHRSKRIHSEIVPINIEDDSSQENYDLNFSSPVKKRKMEPLENITIDNQSDSSDENCEVEYNPDGVHLPTTEKRRIKPKLPFVTSSSHKQSNIHSTNTTNSANNWKTTWILTPKPKEDLSCKIEDSLSDSDEPSTVEDTMIDESSTDSSLMQSQKTEVQETMIETQESITPPVAPFIATTTKVPKKRKIRMVKGGMVERLNKSLSQAKSNLLFWHHHRSAELIPSGTIVTVNRVESTYGRTLIHTKVNNEKTIFCLYSKSLKVQDGDVIEVNFDIDRSYKSDTQVLYAYVDKVLLINSTS